jgi:hypothetical protein
MILCVYALAMYDDDDLAMHDDDVVWMMWMLFG